MEKEGMNNFEEKETVAEETMLEKQEELGKEIKSSKTAKQSWFQIVFEARQEFPEDVEKTIEKIVGGETLSSYEHTRFDRSVNIWWQREFGSPFNSKKKRKIVLDNPAVARSSNKEKIEIGNVGLTQERVHRKEVKYDKEKYDRMRRLHTALRQLDLGEMIGEFEYATRRHVFFDEERDEYVLSGDDEMTPLTLGDILSDYAWDIKYAPDFEKNENGAVTRRLAKRILINEARRDIEEIYNRELQLKYADATGPHNLKKVFSREGNIKNVEVGAVAEIMARETLTRVAVDNDFGFVTLRANGLEDGRYKYDFKIQIQERKRGIEVENEENFEKRLKSLGVQFTKGIGHKLHMILEAKERYGAEIPVDDIVLIKIRSAEFQDAFNAWMRLGKPSGGPEQFLSEELKTDLLKRATDGIVKIKEGAIKNLFKKSGNIKMAA